MVGVRGVGLLLHVNGEEGRGGRASDGSGGCFDAECLVKVEATGGS